MKDSEKVLWLRTFVVFLAFPMAWVIFSLIFGLDEAKITAALAFAWTSVGMCGVTLLILTWRLAYLAGRGKR